MKFSAYFATTTTLAFIGVITVATINYTVDPAGIYHEPDDARYKFVSQMVASENGLLVKNGTWNERDISITLAEYPAEVSCYVIGSSHLMQIGSSRQNKSLVNNCPKLINLGVSGASIEDYVALSGAISRSKNKPKTIVFGIDPWSLNLNRDTRWIRYKDEYTSMLEKIQNTDNNHQQEHSLVSNLINREYLIRSINSISTNSITTEKEIIAPDFDQSIGIENQVRLPDGSMVYSKEFILNAESERITGINNYKIKKDHWFDDRSIQLFIQLAIHLQKKYNIIFIMTPYHPAVWKREKQPVVTAMKIVENKVREIAKSLNVEVLGSYNPDKIGCASDEFFDAMHPKDNCLMKLENTDLPPKN